MPTVLAVHGYQLTDRLEDVRLGSASPSDPAEVMSKEAWSALPERCQGLLLCLTTDAVGTSPRNRFINHPEREPNQTLNEFLASVGVLL